VANESGQTAETGESRKTRGKRQGVGEVVSGIAEILKVALWLSLLILVVFHWSYFSEWFRSATHLELPGIKIDRFDQAAVKVEQYSVTPQARQSGFSPTFAQAAIVRAERVAPALRGALVLWVDDIPENNVLVREILGGIRDPFRYREILGRRVAALAAKWLRPHHLKLETNRASSTSYYVPCPLLRLAGQR
jgi:hypothetical protein